MQCVFFVLLSGASMVLSAAPEVRAGRPGGGLQEVNHLTVLLDRLERLEGQFDEEKRRWQKEKRDWQNEKRDWQNEKRDWQKEKQDWRSDKDRWEQLFRHMQSQIRSLQQQQQQQHQADVPETGGSTDTDDPFPTAKVPESGSASEEISPETPRQRPQDYGRVFARSDDVNALQPVVSEMNRRLGEVAAR